MFVFHQVRVPARRTTHAAKQGAATLLRWVDRWPAPARAAVVVVVLFGGLTVVSLLAAAHRTAASWLLGVALLVPLGVVIASAVRTSSLLMPDLPTVPGSGPRGRRFRDR